MSEQNLKFTKSQQIFRYASSAFYSSLIVSFLHPLDVIRTRLQSHDGRIDRNLVPNYSSVLGAIKQIYVEEGLRGFTKGIMISLLANSSSRILFFVFYEERKYDLNQKFGHNSKLSVLLASIYASLTTSFSTQPIWMIYTRVQLNTQRISGLQNISGCIKQIYSQYGFIGFYRGISLTTILSIHGIIQINSYEYLMNKISQFQIKKGQDFINPFVCGLISKAIAIYFTYPISTIRTRIQQNQFNDNDRPKYKNINDILKKTYKQEGIRGFFKGISASLLKGLPQKGIYFIFYEQMKTKLNISRNQINEKN